jgi:hypothetical protein
MFLSITVKVIYLPPNAGMAELVDALDLGSSAARRGGSTPFTRTNIASIQLAFLLQIII